MIIFNRIQIFLFYCFQHQGGGSIYFKAIPFNVGIRVLCICKLKFVLIMIISLVQVPPSPSTSVAREAL